MTEQLVVVLARDEGLHAALRRLLHREGFAVRSGAGPLGEIVSPDVRDDVVGVLVDARMLAPGGGTGLRELRAAFPSAAVLVMAGRRDHPVLSAAVQQGALALTADFDPRTLVEALRGGSGDGLAGVREPRRPYPSAGSAGTALALPEAGSS